MEEEEEEGAATTTNQETCQHPMCAGDAASLATTEETARSTHGPREKCTCSNNGHQGQ